MTELTREESRESGKKIAKVTIDPETDGKYWADHFNIAKDQCLELTRLRGHLYA